MTDRRSKKELREDLQIVQKSSAKLRSTVVEQATEIESVAKDFAQTVRERDAAQRELDRIEGQKRLKDAAIAHAKEQEIIDGIQAGLIPVEVLRGALKARSGGGVGLRFDLGNPIEKATYEAIARGPKPADSRYTVKSGTISFFPSSLKPTLDDFARGGTVVADAASVTFNIGGHGEKFTAETPIYLDGKKITEQVNAHNVRIVRRGNHPAGSHYFGGVRDAA